jgi:Domain of unknown function (DUF4148)
MSTKPAVLITGASIGIGAAYADRVFLMALSCALAARSSLRFPKNGRFLARLPNLHHNRLEVVTMKSLIQAVVVAAALAAPVAAFAQANPPVTRAQVRAELIQLEKAGYNPSRGQDPYYPADLQAAEAKVAAQNAARGVGGVAGGSSDAGRPAISKADWNALYNHH